MNYVAILLSLAVLFGTTEQVLAVSEYGNQGMEVQDALFNVTTLTTISNFFGSLTDVSNIGNVTSGVPYIDTLCDTIAQLIAQEKYTGARTQIMALKSVFTSIPQQGQIETLRKTIVNQIVALLGKVPQQ
ncbi:MAG: hypothetical protein WCE21_01275 [Candidatus Babeliales bacterium]